MSARSEILSTPVSAWRVLGEVICWCISISALVAFLLPIVGHVMGAH